MVGILVIVISVVVINRVGSFVVDNGGFDQQGIVIDSSALFLLQLIRTFSWYCCICIDVTNAAATVVLVVVVVVIAVDCC